MVLRKIKKTKTVVLILILIPVLLAFFPIKFVKKSTNLINTEEFYIVTCVSEGSTDSGTWIILNSNDEIYDNGLPVILTGRNPKEILSYDICNNYTEFIIYGSLRKENNTEYYTLDSKGWDISEDVKRGNYSYRIPFEHFITIYDLKWFDFLFAEK